MNSDIEIGDIYIFYYRALLAGDERDGKIELFYVCSEGKGEDYVYGTLINGHTKCLYKNFAWWRKSLVNMVKSGVMIQYKKKPNEF